ncbi:MAG TPA: methyltransferase [Caulobacteraceae bacterium]|nr:methyltransferase [Caulobacteraceae bacterium]
MISATIGGFALRLATAPGLFARWGPDKGTLAMLSCVTFEPDDKVLDLGCGYGLVGLVAAKVVGPERVVMSDIDPLAIETARRNLEANGGAGAKLVLSDGFDDISDAGFTKILSNPPYHADFAVPKRFIEKGFNRLAVGGAMFMVTRRDLWYRRKFEAIFGGVKVRELEGYFVFEAIKKSTQYSSRPDRKARSASSKPA